MDFRTLKKKNDIADKKTVWDVVRERFMKRVLRQVAEGISFLELLLDETICEGDILIPKELIQLAGGRNDRLPAKKKYELLLRIAQRTSFDLTEESSGDMGMELLTDDTAEETADGWKTDCYIIGKYSQILQENQVFEMAVASVLEEAQSHGHYEQAVSFLEAMIGHAELFYELDAPTEPVLIYKGDDVCHNVLTVFAEQFGAALGRAGAQIIWYDMANQPLEELLQYRNRHFKAVIGVQSYLFSVKMKDEIHYLHETIYGPKFNFIFDHPVWMKKHLEHQYPDFYVLTHDADYVAFVQNYFRKNAVLFPPAGIEPTCKNEVTRKYDLTFVGTYGNYWNEILLIHQMERKERFLANRFLLVMRKNPDLSSEEALKRALIFYGRSVDKKEFVEILYGLRRVIYCVMHYYRDRVLRVLLDSGLTVNVFGDSWRNSPLAAYENLICHPDVTVEESLLIWQQSKLSLNIMSWHKAGFTERMANIMLAGAVLVTDDTRYLEGRYENGKDLVSFGLAERETLPERIKRLLSDEAERVRIAESGREKTKQFHTWDVRAKEFLELLETLNKNGR